MYVFGSVPFSLRAKYSYSKPENTLPPPGVVDWLVGWLVGDPLVEVEVVGEDNLQSNHIIVNNPRCCKQTIELSFV